MINTVLLQQMIEEKLVYKTKHSNADLYIYNYSPKVQYDKLWNEVTKQTRGLILDGEMNVVARPFGKFFNLEEHKANEIPQLPFDVFEKLDGSLGILYWLNNLPYIATRGSFNSDQAVHASLVLHNKYYSTFNKIDKNKTYLFEIIYPENRIVVDYGILDDLILLTVIDNKTGEESIENIGFPIVKRYDGIQNLSELKSLEEENKEGFVVRFKNGFRVKMKFEEYVRLHRIITGVSTITIWQHFMDGKSTNELLDRVPDEFYKWVKDTTRLFVMQYDMIVESSLSVYRHFSTRKEAAEYILKQEHPAVLFAILDRKPIDKIIWKLIRPKFSKPFKNDKEC